MYLLVHLTDVVTFSNKGLAAVGTLLTCFGVFDAIIDPFVGAIVDNTKTRWGKFKPWILIGMIGTGVLTVLMFHNFDMSETGHIVLLAFTYLLFSIFFSLNDIAYWSLMPAISKDQTVREGVGAFARICANVGMFSMVLIYLNVPGFFPGKSPRDAYFIFAIIIAVIMWVFQSITLFGVKEDRSQLEKAEKTTLKDLIRALAGNDQLLITALSMVLFMIGYCTTTGFGTYYFKYAYKDEGMYMVFAAVLAVAQLTALSVFPLFRKKFSRKQLYTGSMIVVAISYVIFFLSFEFLPLVVLAGLGLFFAQAFIQLLMLLFLADSVEYGEWKLGKRNEAASFAVQPFINQFGGAISKGIVSFTLIISGINMIANEIADAGNNTELAQQILNSTPGSAVWIMKISMMILPLILILVGFVLYQKKFKIDETFYAQIVKDLEERNSKEN
jgi:melibiose permease/lactose/raffinose/galactose permease